MRKYELDVIILSWPPGGRDRVELERVLWGFETLQIRFSCLVGPLHSNTHILYVTGVFLMIFAQWCIVLILGERLVICFQWEIYIRNPWLLHKCPPNWSKSSSQIQSRAGEWFILLSSIISSCRDCNYSALLAINL